MLKARKTRVSPRCQSFILLAHLLPFFCALSGFIRMSRIPVTCEPLTLLTDNYFDNLRLHNRLMRLDAWMDVESGWLQCPSDSVEFKSLNKSWRMRPLHLQDT